MRKYLFISFVVFFNGVVLAQISAPKYANEFLSIGVGARALAMGNTQSAIVNDVTAGYWNPAGLLSQKNKYNVALMHSELFAGIAKNDYLAFSMPVDDSSYFGVSIIRTSVDNIANTLRLKETGTIDYNNITTFGVADYGFLFSYAKKSNIIKGLKLGGTAKVIYRNVGPFANAWGLGIDAGAQFERNGWQIGVMGRDISTTVTVWTVNSELLRETFILTGNEIPENSTEVALPRIIAGGGKKWMIKEKFSLLQSIDFDITTDGKRNTLVKTGLFSIDPKWGMEFGYKGFLFVRSGINNVQQLKDFDDSKFWVVQPNFGLGLNIKNLTVDYALTKVSTGDSGLFSHIFSLKLNFDALPNFN